MIEKYLLRLQHVLCDVKRLKNIQRTSTEYNATDSNRLVATPAEKTKTYPK